MLRIRPFEAIRPARGYESRIASVPYDVVSTEEARQLAGDNPVSFLHVVRSEIDLPEGTDPYDPAVYQQARTALDQLLDDEILIRDESPHLYLYRQVWNHRSQTGVVCCCHIDSSHDDTIRKHERTRQAKEDDRTKHVLATNANTGPVFLTYRDRDAIDRLIERDTNDRPLYHFDAPDGVTHTVWQIDDSTEYISAFEALDAAYVADGHHRAASAARAGAERKAMNPNHTGDEEYNWFLTALFPASRLNILPYNRVVRDLNGMTTDELKQRLAEVGALASSTVSSPASRHVFAIYFDGDWQELALPHSSVDEDDPIASLDAALLQDRVLGPIFGITDPRTDERVDFIGGIRGTRALEDEVNSGRAAAAFSLYPTSVEQLIRVSDADLVMPPKSTWFEPKLRSGLLIHALD